jgi:PTH1 family peptidyl-tRNA hydrolase
VATRHNAGADVVALLADRHGGHLRLAKRERSLVDEVSFDGRRVVLAFPQTFMNESGTAVGQLVRRYGIEHAAQVIVVHDELDLPVGRMRVKSGGGLAGHNGLKSIEAHLKSPDFLRVRIGIGKPMTKAHGVDHVLRAPGKREREELAICVEVAADAVEAIIADGVDAAMNTFNART